VNGAAWRWYWRRLGRMSPHEIGWRVVDHTRSRIWSLHREWPGAFTPAVSKSSKDEWGMATTPNLASLPLESVARVLHAADRLLDGEWDVLGVQRVDMVDPDWSKDPSRGSGFPADRSSFRIDYRSGVHGSAKQVWELSRHQHLTVLACAWQLSKDDRYAAMVDRHLRSWWASNPFLLGVNWSSGIEIGIRLISWVWIRRLLEGWPGAAELFETNDDALQQVYWHQRYLAAFHSPGSSANNHVIAELVGQLICSCAFPWFPESPTWRTRSLAALSNALANNTFATGVNRELASDYHRFVAELGLLAAIEAEAAGMDVPSQTWDILCRMVDVAAAVVDEGLRAPRQGDSDNGRVLVLSDQSENQWCSLLTIGASVFGALPWWPNVGSELTGTVVSSIARRGVVVGSRAQRRPSHFADAGITILRTDPLSEGRRDEEIWCRCDGGPLGFGSLAAHGHADALSVEVRCGGIDILADPGTYCYYEEPEWRRYFRSTRAHNTLTLGNQDQSVSGGPFMWKRHANTRVLEFADTETHQRWSAEHDGYQRLDPPARHRRTVTLDRQSRCLEIVDEVAASKPISITVSFHVGPTIRVNLCDHRTELEWEAASGRAAHAILHLPNALSWSVHRGETDPILGWYSPEFGTKVPSTTLVGSGEATAVTLLTGLDFANPS